MYLQSCKLSDTPSVLELKVFWDLPSVANTRTGKLLCLGCRGAAWCTKRWIQLLLSTCTSSQLTRKATTGRVVLQPAQAPMVLIWKKKKQAAWSHFSSPVDQGTADNTHPSALQISKLIKCQHRCWVQLNSHAWALSSSLSHRLRL